MSNHDRAGGKPRRLVAIGSVLAFVVGAVLVLPWLLGGREGPEDAVREYLDALVTGDVELALEHVDDEHPASNALLNDQIYSAATDKVRSYAIDSVEVDGWRASVEATLDNGIEQRTSTFTLTGQSPNYYSPLEWSLDPVVLPEVKLVAPPIAAEVIINGVAVPLGDLQVPVANPDAAGFAFEFALRLLPGTYEVTLPEADDLTVPGTVELAAVPEFGKHRSATQVITYGLTTAGEEEVRSMIGAHLTLCEEYVHERQPIDCPFFLPSDDPATKRAPGEPSGGTWKVIEQPTLEISPSMHGTHDITGIGGIAEFTPHPSPDGTTWNSHRVDFDVHAVAAIGPDGAMGTTLYGDDSSVSLQLCVDSETGNSYMSIGSGDTLSAC